LGVEELKVEGLKVEELKVGEKLEVRVRSLEWGVGVREWWGGFLVEVES